MLRSGTTRVVLASTTMAVVAVVGLATPSTADPIKLTLHNDTFVFEGEFLGFSQNAYLIASQIGEIYVPASYVSCEGSECIEFVPNPTEIETAILLASE